MSSRRMLNAIISISVSGVQVEGVNGVRSVVFDHFHNHFQPIALDRLGIYDFSFKSITMEEGSMLMLPFLEVEIKYAIWECDNFKSLGPDGINLGFIKDLWDILKEELMHFLLTINAMAKGINNTFIGLISKVERPQRMLDFQPISLANCLYKIISKVFASSLRHAIGSVISESQTTFVKDRQTMDDILIANEMVEDAQSLK